MMDQYCFTIERAIDSLGRLLVYSPRFQLALVLQRCWSTLDHFNAQLLQSARRTMSHPLFNRYASPAEQRWTGAVLCCILDGVTQLTLLHIGYRRAHLALSDATTIGTSLTRLKINLTLLVDETANFLVHCGKSRMP